MTTKAEWNAHKVTAEPKAMTVGQLRASLGQYSDDCEVYLFCLVPPKAVTGNGVFEALVSTCKNGFGCVQLNAENVYARPDRLCPECGEPLRRCHAGEPDMHCDYCGRVYPCDR